MEKLYDKLKSDSRLGDGLKSCINCGICTAICPAAEFYDYDPRVIMDKVQSKDDNVIKELLKGEKIWYCGQCMSCKTRCPRGNAPGVVIQVLRKISIEEGYFVESEKGRQQYAINKMMYHNLTNYGYSIYPRTFKYSMHPECGPVWEWIENNLEDVYARNGANLDGEGPGGLRKIPKESMDEFRKIFDATGATKELNHITKCSMEVAKKMGLNEEEYFNMVFNETEKDHLNH